MLDNRIIELSNSPWASPVVIVKKSDESSKFCIDYRRLNSITQKDVYPLPVSMIGYFQVPLTPEKRAKTAFTTSDGLWEFTILPQGLKKFTISFSMINEPNPWMITYNKCAFFQHEISFLDHKINADGCSSNNDNIRSITQFPLPQSSKAAHSFLQMVGFYRKFIPRFPQISAPLNEFTRKGFPFIWTEAEQLSFDQLKDAINSSAVLILLDPSQPYVIRTDASRAGIGAVLLQKQPPDYRDKSTTSIYKSVAFASRSLKAAEKKYSAIELEALAIW
ncbi:unnamed protein product [Rotaria sp. Silwood1]|nr:unnamed protein product [Rotaria sp. Silwood1]CAF1669228.1 unnamed protein product [Rotaria sp. Silwood1]